MERLLLSTPFSHIRSFSSFLNRVDDTSIHSAEKPKGRVSLHGLHSVHQHPIGFTVTQILNLTWSLQPIELHLSPSHPHPSLLHPFFFVNISSAASHHTQDIMQPHSCWPIDLQGWALLAPGPLAHLIQPCGFCLCSFLKPAGAAFGPLHQLFPLPGRHHPLPALSVETFTPCHSHYYITHFHSLHSTHQNRSVCLLHQNVNS